MQKHLTIKVSGKVQGVFYRASTKTIADQLGIKGFVRNENDGGVYIEAEGDESVLEKFTTWCRQGPPMAHVELFTIEEIPCVGFKDFEIRRSL